MKRPIPGRALMLALTLLPAAPAFGQARASEATTVELAFEVGTRSGAVMVALFDSEGAYQKNTPVGAVRVEVGDGPVKAVFGGVKPGRYAAKAFHDLNDDGALNVNAFDMPVEPFAFSNNAPARFGPASWAEAGFEVGAGGAVQSITLR